MLSQILRDFGEEIQTRHKSITIPPFLETVCWILNEHPKQTKLQYSMT